jgi:signal transduction histidine kinase
MEMADPAFLDDILAEIERMTRLVNDLLLLARADVGSVRIMREPVEFETVFLDVYRQVAKLEQPVKIYLDEVDQVLVLGDRDRLKQLILNLVDNALKYTPPNGEVHLGLSKSADSVHFYVRDSGMGIAQEELGHIFDRFYRVDKARSRAQGGTGLGLSIAKSIVEAHQGEIRVESELGQGTTFYVTLPLMRETGLNGRPAGSPRRVQPAPRAGREENPV